MAVNNVNSYETLLAAVEAEVMPFLKEQYPNAKWPPLQKSKEAKLGDFTVVCTPIMSRAKVAKDKWEEWTTALAEKLNATLTDEKRVVKQADAAGPYLNIRVNRTLVLGNIIKNIVAQGDKYGSSDRMKGKKVIIEHTSANPCGPLHIGNLRNVMLGGHIAKLLEFVGYDVKQHFYVNDLGAQIGLTALGYASVDGKIEPTLKSDAWIGFVYAIMNTLAELQVQGFNIAVVFDEVKKGGDPSDIIERLPQDVLEKAKKEKVEECVDILSDVNERQPVLTAALVDGHKDIDIKIEAGKLNLAYEKKEEDAVKLFRSMVDSCIEGMAQTLKTYNIKHDKYDYESELGWEGHNDRVLEMFKATDYYTEQTQCNDKGKPEGSYLDLDAFIKNHKLKQGGRNNYQKNYPRLYVLRPDGSTLYSFRDVVYSEIKESQADLVLNLICSEQNLPQQKVSLALRLIDQNTAAGSVGQRKQFHVTYELVKLAGVRAMKMSTRRARYLTSDDLYAELREIIVQEMTKKFAAKQMEVDEALFKEVADEVSTAAMKYALLSVSCNSQIKFDFDRITNFQDASAPFLLYNGTRFNSLRTNMFNPAVAAGKIAPLPPIEEARFDLLVDDDEWKLVMDYILPFPGLVLHCACPTIPDEPKLPQFSTSQITDFLVDLVRDFSKYYARVKIVRESEPDVTHARLYWASALQQVLNNGLRLLTITPVEKM
eukprot:TRINITY_DN14614_c0_g1_i1.p1 TRINITY_DN14614_c0_g1~~TRINITY_DN14614_c0_g1_i1.p1  ORF type:complete len:711 (+),score=253.56 TRINITY_DN14614_c0_g1_i1:127-2259(+)